MTSCAFLTKQTEKFRVPNLNIFEVYIFQSKITGADGRCEIYELKFVIFKVKFF